MAGKVYLVGAGPGDKGLLTLKAASYLKQADTVVYDHLVEESVLEYAPPEAEFIYVGKISNRHTMKQEDICRLLADLAKEGKNVVRLKGGDPFVFGRGGEEALLLRANDIPFEIVPGVTSAISVPAYAGIPVTHRGTAASFSVVTGHENPGKNHSDINWEKLATATDTLVFLMGVANLPIIAANLMKYGRRATTPVAVIRWGTRLKQQVWTSNLAEVSDMAKKEAIQPPCIILVGDVVNLREKLAWFDKKPLFGKKILVTRARPQASKLTSALEGLGAECVEAPVIKIVPPSDGYRALDSAIDNIIDYDWLIFTSTNGVEHFFARMEEKGKDARALYKNKICAIGSATAKALSAHGLMVDLLPEQYQAEGIIQALSPQIAAGTKVLIPRAGKAREILPAELKKLGAAADVVPAYETVTGEADGDAIGNMLRNGEIDIVTFTSSSTVSNLLSILGTPEVLKNAKLAAIGPITAETLTKNGLQADVVAGKYTIEGLVQSVREAF